MIDSVYDKISVLAKCLQDNGHSIVVNEDVKSKPSNLNFATVIKQQFKAHVSKLIDTKVSITTVKRSPTQNEHKARLYVLSAEDVQLIVNNSIHVHELDTTRLNMFLDAI
jgi:hypothetical protein